MPFRFDLEGPDAPEDWADAEDMWEEFEYVAPEAYSGVPQPVSVRVAQPPDEAQESELKLGFLARIRNVFSGKSTVSQETQREYMLFLVFQAMRKLGGTHAVFAYDGGNDEGFAWFRELRTSDGQLTREEVIAALHRADLISELKRLAIINDSPDFPRNDEQHLTTTLDWWVATELCVAVLGEDYGVGPALLYGACVLDLETYTLNDDDDADYPTDKPADM